MKRIDIVNNALKRLCESIMLEDIKGGFNGFSTETISEYADITRTNASKELNSLVKDNKAIKILGRPVLYFSKQYLEKLFGVKIEDDVSLTSLADVANQTDKTNINIINEENLDLIAKQRPSLSKAVKLGKASVIYPPNGLHSIIIGESGVGKTFFAEAMYNYAIDNGSINKEGKFIIFNCAEYSDNPQLLVSQLFGYAKGAFTGAEHEQSGIIDEADGGVLLLDEVHRLPPQGQEILFTLIDKGYFRRLGESSKTNKVNLRLICATTENIESNLLVTFLRRIPMIIFLPSLSESTIEERFDIIEKFFCRESKILGMDIEVSREVILGLLFYNPKGNIGQLRSDIQMICAKGFLEYKLQSQNEGNIKIGINLLPDEVYYGILNIKDRRNEIEKISKINGLKIFLFSGNAISSTSKTSVDISPLYEQITRFYKSYLKRNMHKKEIESTMNTYIQQYMNSLIHKNNMGNFYKEKEKLTKIVSKEVYKVVINAIEMAELRLGRKLEKKTMVALILHISALLERISTKYVSEITMEELKKIEESNPHEYTIACEMKDYIENQLNVSIPKQELAFFVVFLSTTLSDSNRDDVKQTVGTILIAHGESTATSMAEVVNSLLNTNICKAVDMKLIDSVEECLNKVTDLVVETDTGKGVLLLVDMGSLNAFAEIIHQRTNIEVRCIEMVSTAIALEAVRKSLFSDETLDNIANSLLKHIPYTGKMVSREFIKNKNTNRNDGNLIIVTCISGKGVALKLVELIKDQVPSVQKGDYEIKAYDYKGTELTLEDKKRTVLLVGASDLKIDGVPYVGIEEIIMGKGLRKIERILSNVELEDNEIEIPNYVVSKILTEYLTFLNPVKANETVNMSFEYILKNINFKEKTKIELKYLVHCCCMIERVILNQPLNYENVKNVIEKNKDRYEILKKAFEIIENIFSINIPDTEIAYVLDLINTD